MLFKQGVFAGVLLASAVVMSAQNFKYPQATKSNHVDEYGDNKIADPYRWLENPDSPESQAWIEAENKITFGYLEKIPAREQLKKRLTELWNYERYGVPFQEGGRYFYTRNDGLQNQSVLYWAPRLNAEPKVLLDPNKLSADGTVALKGYSISEDGRFIAYGLSASGSDWEEWRVKIIDSGEEKGDYLKWVKFSGISWLRDGTGFFYCRYDEPKENEKLQSLNYFQKLYFHKLGTAQSEDFLVFHTPEEKEWMFDGHVTEDGKYLIITVDQGTDRRSRIYYKELDGTAPNLAYGKGSPVVKLLDAFDANYTFIGNDGPTFYIKTDKEAPRSRLVAVDAKNGAPNKWKTILAESNDTLQGLNIVNHQFIASYMQDAKSAVRIFAKDGKLVRELELPGIGSAGGFGGDEDDTETFYAFSSFTVPGEIYRYDLTTGKSEIFRKPSVKFDSTQFETKQVFFNSKDGTRVPMFITARKGLNLDANNPTLLYGYGGFNISLTPSFSASAVAWLELGGVYAQPNLRGGGEYGEQWHKSGTRERKQNVFDDFIGAAEWLIANKYTRAEKLGIAGGSNGGLLVGACMTQRPELFGAALPAVGVMDMLRFHKFTIGWAWVSDYGSPDKPEEFKYLRAYSPLHNLKSGTKYPSTMITTADHDDRVVPAHSFKFAAALQEAHRGENPVLIRIETKAGHGAGKPTTKLIEEAADRYAFLVRELGVANQ